MTAASHPVASAIDETGIATNEATTIGRERKIEIEARDAILGGTEEIGLETMILVDRNETREDEAAIAMKGTQTEEIQVEMRAEIETGLDQKKALGASSTRTSDGMS